MSDPVEDGILLTPLELEAIDHFKMRMKAVISKKYRKNMRWTNRDIWAVNTLIKAVEDLRIRSQDEA